MKGLWQAARLDISESVRSRWFLFYSTIFCGLLLVLMLSGLANSRVLGFTGLSRVLMIYIQLCMAVLPIFVLLTIVRSVAGDREAGVYEYLLSLPVSLRAWFWGKLLGRFLVIFLPVCIAMVGAAIWAALQSFEIPWVHFLYNMGLIVSLAGCFLGIGALISALTRSVDLAQGAAFFIWLCFLLFIDIILLGMMVANQVEQQVIVGMALANPLQVFRVGSMLLFDPTLMLMGPAAFVIVDSFGRVGFLIYALAYPLFVGLLASAAGYFFFRRGDLP